jgi:amino acid adenylation domain-containing protein
MVLLAAFQALLHRLTGEDDLVVGTPIANRTHPALEGLIGFFVNTLALRSRLDGADPRFGELLGRARAAALAAYAHQDLPFEKLVEELRVERSLQHAPVFQVMLVLQNAPAAELALPGLTLAPVTLAPGAAKHDMSVTFVEGGSEIRAALEVDAALFDAATAERLLERLGVLLREIAAHPDRRLSELPVMGEAERRQVLEWGEAGAPPPASVLVHRLFEEHATRAPEALAIGGDGGWLTYGELDRAANRLAHSLRAAGAGLETRVAVSMERPEGWGIALLAVLKAGAAYVPLDLRLPRERQELLIADSGASILLTEETLPGLLSGGPETRPAVEIPPEALAYIFYTSGSTGVPKGVGVPHDSFARHLLEVVRRHGIGPGDRMLGAYAEGFDPSLEQMLGPLVSGGAFFLRAGAIWSASELADRIERWGITAAMLSSAYWRQVVLELDAAGRTFGAGSVRVVETGGEAMPVEVARRWPAVAPGALLLNSYCPTETVITPTLYETPEEIEATPSGSVPIGWPLAGRFARVVDRWGELAPLGVAGELLLGGLLARGYLGRPAATAAAFVPDPDPQAAPGSRLYRTGDRVRRREDGALEFLGRIDRQVKVRGYRIEPGEIEAALLAEPAVREAAVVAQDDAAGGKRLAAWLVPRNPQAGPPDPELLRASLRRRLPEPMIPAAFGWLDALPLTANGKLDRRALAQRETGRPASLGEVPPRDGLEPELARIWEDLLGVRPVGARDDFFDLGGHSLLAVRLASRIETAFGRPLPIATLFERRTVEALADWLRPSVASEAASPLVRIQPDGSRPPLFMVHPGGGGVLCYADLARALGPDQPLYGLQAPGLDGERPPFDEVGVLADLYLEALQAVRPAGPWHLGGWSFGGLVAYEMACRLAERGEAIGLVAILDAPLRDAPEVSQADDVELLVRGLGEVFLQAVPVDPAELRGLDTRAQVALVLDRAWRAGLVPDDFDEIRAAGLVEVFKANLRAARTWEPHPYSGRITVVRAAGSDVLGPDLDGGWGAFADAGVVTVPGDHHRMVAPPNVETLAQALRAALDGAER